MEPEVKWYNVQVRTGSLKNPETHNFTIPATDMDAAIRDAKSQLPAGTRVVATVSQRV